MATQRHFNVEFSQRFTMTNYDQRPERERLQFDRQCESTIIPRECAIIAFDVSGVSFDEWPPETILGILIRLWKEWENCDSTIQSKNTIKCGRSQVFWLIPTFEFDSCARENSRKYKFSVWENFSRKLGEPWTLFPEKSERARRERRGLTLNE